MAAIAAGMACIRASKVEEEFQEPLLVFLNRAEEICTGRPKKKEEPARYERASFYRNLMAPCSSWMHLVFVGVHAWLGLNVEEDSLEYCRGKRVPMRTAAMLLLNVVAPEMGSSAAPMTYAMFLRSVRGCTGEGLEMVAQELLNLAEKRSSRMQMGNGAKRKKAVEMLDAFCCSYGLANVEEFARIVRERFRVESCPGESK